MKSRLLPCVLLGSLLLAATAGCNSTATTAETKQAPAATKAEPAKESRQEYVRVNSMGSWIPRKVKKQSDLIGDNTKTAEAGALQRVQESSLSNTVRDGSR